MRHFRFGRSPEEEHHHDEGRGEARHFMRGFDRHFRHEFGRHFHGAWSGRTRRGDVKFVVLEMLADGPKHGYEIIRAIEDRRGVRPSAGSVYPTLQMLEDGGFVSSAQIDGKRVYTITESGRELLGNRVEDPEEADAVEDPRHRLRDSMMKLGAAVMSARGGNDATIERIRGIVDRARKEIYTILGSDES